MFCLPITIHTRRFPPRGFHAITLFPFVFYNDCALSERELRHETVHLWQQAALLWVGFYILYLLFWLVGMMRYRNRRRAYREIPFERSAYTLEREEHTPGLRQAFDWVGRMKG